MLEIGPKILGFYLSYIYFFRQFSIFLLMWNTCGLLRNKRYMNKLLLLLLELLNYIKGRHIST